MAIVGTLPNNIQDGQVADAVPVMANFNFLVNQVNANAQSNTTPPSGTLINIQTAFSTQVFSPSSQYTNQVVIFLVGGGGAGGGSIANAAGQISCGTGGNGGCLTVARLNSGFAGQTITIGAGGTGAVGQVGGNGGASSFAACTAPGGTGGQIAQSINTSTASVGPAAGTGGTGGFYNGTQSLGGPSLFVQNQGSIIGSGAGGPYGNGGGGVGIFNGTGGNGLSPGAGGGGTANGPSQIARAGGNGANGMCIIYEFS